MSKTILIAMITVAFATVGLAEESAMHAASKQSGKKAPATKKTSPVLTQAPAPIQRTLSPLTSDSPLVSLAKRTKSARKMTLAKLPVVIDNDTVRKTKGVISEATANNNFNPPKPPGEEEGAEQEPAVQAEAPQKPVPQGPAKRSPQEIAVEQSYVNDQLNDPSPNDLDEDRAEKKMYELQQEQHEAQQPPPQ